MILYLYREPCQSGLTYLFAKEAGCKSPREFESRRLRQVNELLHLRVRFERLFCVFYKTRKVPADVISESVRLRKNIDFLLKGGIININIF